MALSEVITKLNNAGLSENQEHYLNITKLLSKNDESVYDALNSENVKSLCHGIVNDLKKETTELPLLGNLLQSLFSNKHLQKYLPETDKAEIVKEVISVIESSQHENVLVNCFSVLIQVPFTFNLEITVLNDLLKRMEDVLIKKNEPASTYCVCNYFQKFLRENEGKLSEFTSMLSKLVFLPLCHSSNKVREIAEKNLDIFPKILLYVPDEEATTLILKLVKDSFSKNMLQLIKEKQELYVLKVWKHVVNALGNDLSTNLSGMTIFFQVIEKCFKSSADDVCIQAFIAWKSLIDNLGASGALNDSKKLRFVLKPLKNTLRASENILSAVCDTWMHLAWNLAGHLSSRFSEVCIPLLELTARKTPNGFSEKSLPKGGSFSLVKKSCYILLRFLEQPPSEAFNRLSSPKKLPNIPYPPLQYLLDIKTITHHFKEILFTFKIIIDVCDTKDDMRTYLDCLMKSVLFVVSTVIEDSNKESKEAVTHYLNFLTDIIETKVFPPLACLKCLESLSKLPRKVLISHCFNCGSRKTQDILCTILLKLLLNPHLFPSELPKRFYATYNRLVNAGICDSFYPLSNTHKFMHVIRSSIGTNTFEVDVYIEIWSGVATPILEIIEKTHEINQGDKQEHDFSCMYDVLLFPFEFIFPTYIQQFRARPVIKLWTTLYKVFIRSASLVATSSTNEACENFCSKLKSLISDEFLKQPHFFESLCTFMQSILESIDFVSGNTSGPQGIAEVALMMKRKKPLGNLTSFVDLYVMLLKAYLSHYVEAEDSVQSNAPAVQRKLHIVKSGAPLDILKNFFANIRSGSLIPFVLEQLADPVSKLFLKSSQKRNSINHIDAKLEMVWNVISASVERYYIGPYDSEFLTLMSPMLEATFSHTKRNFKEKSRKFWFATFAPNASSLKFPESLKNVLKKMKLPLLLDDISPAEFSISPMGNSATEDSIDLNFPVVSKPSISKPQLFKTPASVNGELSKAISKENKQSPKVPIDDLPSEEFVKIDSPIVSTPHRRNVRKRRSYVPTLYNDLSQDSATLLSSSESQDTMCSVSLEKDDFKKPEQVEVTSEKELLTSPTSHKDMSIESKHILSSPMSAKFEEEIDRKLGKTKEILVSIELSGNNNGIEISNAKKVNLDSLDNDKEKEIENNIRNKISVFSKASEKKLASQCTRKNSRLSQSFSVSSSRKEKSEKLECQKLNKSCIELVELSDSDEIIPSSQSSSETESSTKISVNNGEQKPLDIDNSSSDVKQVHPFVENKNKEMADGNLELEMLNDDVITSTPLKSREPVLMDGNKSCGSLACKTELTSNNAPTLCVKIIKNNKTGIPLVSDQIVDKELHVPEEIKDLNFLLDAVDNLVNSVPDLGKIDNKPVDTIEPQCDVEMIDISTSDDKTLVPDFSNIHDGKRQSKIDVPVAKRSRLNLKTVEISSSGSQNYTHKLRNKSTNSIKPQPKAKKKRSVNKNANLKNDNIKEDVLKIENGQLDTTDFSKSSDHKKNEEIRLRQEKSKIHITETVQINENVFSGEIVEQNMENSGMLVDKAEINRDNVQNAESCEIFEELTDSCKDAENNIKELNADVDIISVDSRDSNCISELNEKKNSYSGLQISEANECESQMVDVDDMNCITIIPSSLDNESSTDVSNKFIYKENIKESNGPTIESYIVTPLQDKVNSITDITNNISENDFVTIQFSIIEDDVSCEMQNIVESVVNACCQDSISDDLIENQVATSEQEQQLSKNSDKENNFSAINEKASSLNETENVHSLKSEIIDESSNDDSANVFNYDSSSGILSHSERELESSAEIGDNFDAMNTENAKSCVDDENVTKNRENVSDLKLTPENQEKSVFGSNGNNPYLELNHPSVISNQISGISVAPHKDENNSVEVINFVPPCQKEDIKCNEAVQGNIENITDVKMCDSTQKNTNIGTPETIKILEEPHKSIFDSSSEKISEKKLFIKKASSNYSENEVNSIIKELIVKVEKLSHSQIIAENCDFSSSKIPENLSNSSKIADKENQMSSSGMDDTFAKGSKKRKIKPPIRSPFNFRQRNKMENVKKLQKGVKSLNVSHLKSVTENTDLVIKSIFPKEYKNEENADSSMAKIISSIVDSITSDDDDIDKDIYPDIPSSSQMPKGSRIEMSNDELTDLNTRLNASTAPQTRRSKLMAATHKVSELENEPKHSNVVILCSEKSSNKLSGILKKRKSSEPSPPTKARKVTFASPLIHEVVIENISEAEGVEIFTMNRIHSLNRKHNKILQEKNKKATPAVTVLSVGSADCDEVPSSSEYQDSDVLDFSDLPVSPALINCPDDVSNILKDLTSPSWIRGLESLLVSKNIKTIGDLCKLNIHQVKALPFKSPKVLTLHKALMAYINNTQDTTLQKFKTIDDGSFETDAPSSSCDNKKAKNTDIADDGAKPKSYTEIAIEMLKKERLKDLPLNVLGQLVEACGKIIVEKTNKS